jgi:acetyltransferase-like isoleucine patch superfamily enzyme
VTWPFAQPASLLYKWRGSEALFDFSAKLFSLVPGKIGQYLRTSFYMQTLSGCHADLAVSFGSFFSRPTASVGRLVTIGSFSIIGNAQIGDEVMVASRTSILSGRNHHGSIRTGVQHNEVTYGKVTIGSNCWIGEGVIVMASIGANCIVGAGAVVTKPFGSDLVLAGNPARILPGG